MSEKMRLYVKDSLKNEMRAILGISFAEENIDKLANDAVSEIDWNDSALMHKDMAWLATYYLKKRKIA